MGKICLHLQVSGQPHLHWSHLDTLVKTSQQLLHFYLVLRKKLLLHVWYTGATTENRKATQQVINTVRQNNWLFTATPGDHQQILLSQKNHCYHRSSLPCLPPVWPAAPGWRLTNSVFPKTIQTVNSITPHTQATHIQPLNSNQVRCVLCYCLFVCFFINSSWLYIFRVFFF